METETRTFVVRVRDGRTNHHRVEARDPEEAALAFADAWCPDEEDEVTVLVTDCEDGREICLTLDLHDGETRRC